MENEIAIENEIEIAFEIIDEEEKDIWQSKS
jgi:hypothetical protein